MNSDQREEIARLKGLKSRPSIRPSGMDQGTEPKAPSRRIPASRGSGVAAAR
jgi:hypothetical protein